MEVNLIVMDGLEILMIHSAERFLSLAMYGGYRVGLYLSYSVAEKKKGKEGERVSCLVKV